MRMRFAVPLAILVAIACSKPPKTTVDVDTMQEASFVKDVDDAGAASKNKAPVFVKDDADDDTPVPALQSGGPAPSAASSPSKLPDPEIVSQPKPPSKVDVAAGKKGGSDKVTAPECQEMLDHFLDLVLASDPRFQNIGPEGNAMVRQIAAQDPRFAQVARDCQTQVSRARYNCAVSAKTPAAWQTCLK